jgi:predicted  nucleic acid-binding Zn-ribbon protein
MRTLRFATIFFASTLATLVSGAAVAQNAADLSQLPAWTNELKAKQLEAGQAATEVSSAVDAMAPKKKEIALWDGELEKMRPQYADWDQKVSTHNADAAKQRAAVATHKTACPAKVASKAQADRCNGELAPLNAWNSRIDSNKARLNGVLTQINTRRDTMVNRRKQIVSDLQPMQARYDQAKAKLDAAKQRVETLQNWIIAARATCAKIKAGSQDVGEALHYCNSMQWDNAIPGLPPLNNPQPPFSATPNR